MKAVVTGGTSGIGYAIAMALAREGADLWLVARNRNNLHTAKKNLLDFGIKVNISSTDLSDIIAVRRVGSEIMSFWSGIDVLVNNAGLAHFTSFGFVSDDEMQEQISVNMIAPYVLTQQLLPALIQAKGSVITVSSSSAQRLIQGRPASVYAMTKGAVNSLTKALASELGPYGVRVNAIAPGTVNTPLTQRVLANMSEKQKREYQKLFPLGRIGDPEDIAGFAVYLASREARWVTGGIFNIDGGLTTN